MYAHTVLYDRWFSLIICTGLEHATIRDNIIFGSPVPFDTKRYEAVVHACALEQDLAILDAGDKTGTFLTSYYSPSLSPPFRNRRKRNHIVWRSASPDRSRKSTLLARESDSTGRSVCDPHLVASDLANSLRSLAAVDMHTAQHIVKNCFTGSLSERRTIILVTHHISLCAPIAAYLLKLKDGKVLHQGSTDDLRAQGLLQTIVKEEETPYAEPETPPTSPTVDTSRGVAAPRSASDGKLVEVEHRAEGRVSWRTYTAYLKAAGIHCWILTFILYILIRLINVASQVYGGANDFFPARDTDIAFIGLPRKVGRGI